MKARKDMPSHWIAAVYQIKCKVTGDFYIGGTQNVEKRWNTHRYQLRKGTHPVKRMQDDWNMYGEDAFEFTILEEVPPEAFFGSDLMSTYRVFWIEQHYTMRMKPQYNRMIPA